MMGGEGGGGEGGGNDSVRDVRRHEFGSIRSNVSLSPFRDSFKCLRQATVRWWSEEVVRQTVYTIYEQR